LVDKKFTPKYPPNIRYFSQISTPFHLNSRISIAWGEGGLEAIEETLREFIQARELITFKILTINLSGYHIS
jgi:hypothetical protein